MSAPEEEMRMLDVGLVSEYVFAINFSGLMIVFVWILIREEFVQWLTYEIRLFVLVLEMLMCNLNLSVWKR